jgi:hypothetical protein
MRLAADGAGAYPASTARGPPARKPNHKHPSKHLLKDTLLKQKHTLGALACCALIGAALPATALESTTTGFDAGREGWTAPQGSGGASWITRRAGNDAPAYRTVFEDFGITFSNHRNASFLGDYTALPAIEIGLDVRTKTIEYFGADVTRDLVVELRDHDNAPDGMPYVSVWYKLGTLDATVKGWNSFSVTIDDTSAIDLPEGWGGYGAEDPDTYEPMLPEGRSFASVLAGVDEIAFTTLVPGFMYGFTFFDVAVDNLHVRAVPEPGTAALLALGLAGLGWRARRGRAAG